MGYIRGGPFSRYTFPKFISPKEAQIVFENLKKKFHCERSELRLQKKKILQIPQFFL